MIGVWVVLKSVKTMVANSWMSLSGWESSTPTLPHHSSMQIERAEQPAEHPTHMFQNIS